MKSIRVEEGLASTTRHTDRAGSHLLKREARVALTFQSNEIELGLPAAGWNTDRGGVNILEKKSRLTFTSFGVGVVFLIQLAVGLDWQKPVTSLIHQDVINPTK